jgi:hypothetical protein
VYLKYLEHENPDLRFDALVCLRPITKVQDYIDVYRKCLRDKDTRICELALNRLSEEATESILDSLRGEIQDLLNDPDMKIKRAALNIQRKNKN